MGTALMIVSISVRLEQGRLWIHRPAFLIEELYR